MGGFACVRREATREGKDVGRKRGLGWGKEENGRYGATGVLTAALRQEKAAFMGASAI